jgi:hypothetical protein
MLSDSAIYSQLVADIPDGRIPPRQTGGSACLTFSSRKKKGRALIILNDRALPACQCDGIFLLAKKISHGLCTFAAADVIDGDAFVRHFCFYGGA